LASAAANGDAASVRPSGVSGWTEILIQPNLARTAGLVSCGSAGDHPAGGNSSRINLIS
jgi:hypothetical protein